MVDKLTQGKPATLSPSSEQDDTRGGENHHPSRNRNHDNTTLLKESTSVGVPPEDPDAENGIEVKQNGSLTLEFDNV